MVRCNIPVFVATLVFEGALSLFGGTYICVPASGAIETNLTVAIPYIQSFESRTNGAPIGWPGNEWIARSGDATSIRVEPYTYGHTPPLATNHTLVANLDTEGQTLLCSVTGTASHVWVDQLIRFMESEDEPIFSGEFGLALYSIYDIGLTNLIAYGRTSESATYEAIVSTVSVDQSRWYRLTLHLAYLDEPADAFFSVLIDQTPVEWPGGESLPGVASPSGFGPWLRFAYKPATKAFPGLQFSGTGMIDDLVIDNRYRGPVQAATAGVEQAMAVTWPSDYGRIYRVDWCPTLSSNTWQTLQGAVIGNGTTNTVFDLKQNTSARFYRVVPLDP
jgi:hypothetical protein